MPRNAYPYNVPNMFEYVGTDVPEVRVLTAAGMSIQPLVDVTRKSAAVDAASSRDVAVIGPPAITNVVSAPVSGIVYMRFAAGSGAVTVTVFLEAPPLSTSWFAAPSICTGKAASICDASTVILGTAPVCRIKDELVPASVTAPPSLTAIVDVFVVSGEYCVNSPLSNRCAIAPSHVIVTCPFVPVSAIAIDVSLIVIDPAAADKDKHAAPSTVPVITPAPESVIASDVLFVVSVDVVAVSARLDAPVVIEPAAADKDRHAEPSTVPVIVPFAPESVIASDVLFVASVPPVFVSASDVLPVVIVPAAVVNRRHCVASHVITAVPFVPESVIVSAVLLVASVLEIAVSATEDAPAVIEPAAAARDKHCWPSHTTVAVPVPVSVIVSDVSFVASVLVVAVSARLDAPVVIEPAAVDKDRHVIPSASPVITPVPVSVTVIDVLPVASEPVVVVSARLDAPVVIEPAAADKDRHVIPSASPVITPVPVSVTVIDVLPADNEPAVAASDIHCTPSHTTVAEPVPVSVTAIDVLLVASVAVVVVSARLDAPVVIEPAAADKDRHCAPSHTTVAVPVPASTTANDVSFVASVLPVDSIVKDEAPTLRVLLAAVRRIRCAPSHTPVIAPFAPLSVIPRDVSPAVIRLLVLVRYMHCAPSQMTVAVPSTPVSASTNDVSLAMSELALPCATIDVPVDNSVLAAAVNCKLCVPSQYILIEPGAPVSVTTTDVSRAASVPTVSVSVIAECAVVIEVPAPVTCIRNTPSHSILTAPSAPVSVRNSRVSPSDICGNAVMFAISGFIYIGRSAMPGPSGISTSAYILCFF